MTQTGDSELAAELAMESAGDGAAQAGWHRLAAFTTLVLAVFAAVAALYAGITSGQILFDRTEEIIDASLVESDLIRAEILRAKHDVLAGLGLPVPPEELDDIAVIEDEAKRIKEDAERVHEEAFVTENAHLVFAIAATIFAVAIAITGLSVIVGKRWLWATGGLIGLVGLGFLVVAFVEMV